MMSYFIRSNGDHSYWSRHSKVWIQQFRRVGFCSGLNRDNWILPYRYGIYNYERSNSVDWI